MKNKFSNEKFLKLWRKADLSQKKKIFYYSLFDFKSFEEEARIDIINEIRDVQNSLIKLIKNIDKGFFSKTKRAKFVQYAGNDFLLKNILIFELNRNNINAKSCGNNFPDLMIGDSIHLEIKRQISTKNMGKDFWGVDNKECGQLLLLLFFPMLKGDDEGRINDLTNGYYFIKDYLGNKRHSEVLLCHPHSENFEEILEKIVRCVENPRWCRNE